MPEPVVARGPFTVAVDQGTSATKALLVAADGTIAARASAPLSQSHPQPGWVEQDPEVLLESVRGAVTELLSGFDGDVSGIGLSTQRESALAWDRETGRALSPVLGWQDRRTAERARRLAPHAARIREISGLPLDPMFSALKLSWILDEVDPDRTASAAGRIAVGTVDSWLMNSLAGEHRIEVGNASRTQLLDLSTGDWSDELLDLFDIPRPCLPRACASDAPAANSAFDGIAIRAVLGDSHAALFGHGARTPGDVKVTYGTGSSIMGLTDEVVTGPGLVGTIAWGLSVDRQNESGVARAFEGNILSTGATVAWLAGLLGVAPDAVAELARSAQDSDGVDIVPAFAGLGAPWWDEDAVAIASGMQLGTRGEHLARAAFESVALQIEDVLSVAEREIGISIERVLADGGPSRNSWLMQMQADLSERTVRRHDGADLSALGAATLAAEAAGIVDSCGFVADHTDFIPNPSFDAASRRARWNRAVTRSRSSTDTNA